MGRLKGLGEMDAAELREVIGTGRKIGRVTIDDPAGFAKLAEQLFGSKSELRKTWFLQQSGETLAVGGGR